MKTFLPRCQVSPPSLLMAEDKRWRCVPLSISSAEDWFHMISRSSVPGILLLRAAGALDEARVVDSA